MLPVVVLVLALLVAVIAGVGVAGLRVWRAGQQLRDIADVASSRLEQLGDELADEMAVFEREQDALRASLEQLRAQRARPS